VKLKNPNGKTMIEPELKPRTKSHRLSMVNDGNATDLFFCAYSYIEKRYLKMAPIQEK